METKREKVNRVCPITGLDFFMRIEDESGNIVDTFGGPFDSYTTPTNDGEDWIWERYCHDRGYWMGPETVPDSRIIDHLKTLTTSQEQTIERLREGLKEGDWAAYNWLDDEGNDNWKIGRIVKAPESKELMYYVDDDTTRCGFIPISLGVKLLKNDLVDSEKKFRNMLQKIVDAEPLDRWMHMKEAEQLLNTTEPIDQ